jgi:hypothetical protein
MVRKAKNSKYFVKCRSLPKFLAENLKAETAVAEPPKIKISLAEADSFDLLSTQGSPTIK